MQQQQQQQQTVQEQQSMTVESVVDAARQLGMKESALKFFQSQLQNANHRKKGIRQCW